MPLPPNARLVAPSPEIGPVEPLAADYEKFRPQWERFYERLYRDLDSLHKGTRGGTTHARILTWMANDATPSVSVPEPSLIYTFHESYTAPTNVTTFDDGADGQLFTVHFSSGNITLKDGATLQLADGGADLVGYSGIEVLFRLSSGVWRELARSET